MNNLKNILKVCFWNDEQPYIYGYDEFLEQVEKEIETFFEEHFKRLNKKLKEKDIDFRIEKNKNYAFYDDYGPCNIPEGEHASYCKIGFHQEIEITHYENDGPGSFGGYVWDEKDDDIDYFMTCFLLYYTEYSGLSSGWDVYLVEDIKETVKDFFVELEALRRQIDNFFYVEHNKILKEYYDELDYYLECEEDDIEDEEYYREYETLKPVIIPDAFEEVI